VAPPGDTRPAWKLLRVLGNLLDLDGFEYQSSTDVLSELAKICGNLQPDNKLGAAVEAEPACTSGLTRVGDVPIYALDPLVRRAEALQDTVDAEAACIRVNSDTAAALGLSGAEKAVAVQGSGRTELPLKIDDCLPDDCVRISAGLPGTESLGGQFAELTLEKG
jgi:NADH-quinone oxidoreductase subunit G